MKSTAVKCTSVMVAAILVSVLLYKVSHAQMMGSCVSGGPDTTEPGRCDKSAGTKCQDLTAGECAAWSAGRPSQKVWLNNRTVGTCTKKNCNQEDYCETCPNGTYCANGKKFRTVDDCNSRLNPICEIWGYSPDVCERTM
jgi:hypothetical protein